MFYFTVVLDYAGNPKSPTGRFECVYRQPMSGPRYGVATDLSVRGYSLPHEYFYKGTIPLQKSIDNLVVEKEKDIKSILKRLKQIYEADIMVEPEDDEYSNMKKEQETYTHLTESEQDLQDAATVINEQIDDLLDRITSVHTDSSKSPLRENFAFSPLHTIPSKKSSQIDSCQSYKSLTEVKSLMKKRSLNRFASSEAIIVKRPFCFSKLDDAGSQGRGSLGDINSIKQHFLKIASNYTISSEHQCDNHCQRNRKTNPITNIISFPKTTSKAQDSIIEASSKILTFLQEKEREYTKDAKQQKT